MPKLSGKPRGKAAKGQGSGLQGGLYRNPNGLTWHYHVKWRGQTRKGDTKCVDLPDARQALAALKQKWADEENGVVREKGTAPTLERVLEAWLSEFALVHSKKHLRAVEDAARLHMRPLLSVPVDTITGTDVAAIRDAYLRGSHRYLVKLKAKGGRVVVGTEWRERPHTMGGANDVLKHFRTLMRWAVEQKHLPALPFQVKLKKVQRRPRPVLPTSSVQTFMAQVDRARNPHIRIAIRLMLALGLREGEALRSRWEWIDWERSTYTPGETKDKEPRTIPVPAWLLADLKALPIQEIYGWILPAEDGEPHRRQFTTKTIKRAEKACGLFGLHPHRLRATFATAHAEIGTPLHEIQELLGHEEIETTRLYIESCKKGLREAQESVAAAMGFPGTAEPARGSQVVPEKVA